MCIRADSTTVGPRTTKLLITVYKDQQKTIVCGERLSCLQRYVGYPYLVYDLKTKYQRSNRYVKCMHMCCPTNGHKRREGGQTLNCQGRYAASSFTTVATLGNASNVASCVGDQVTCVEVMCTFLGSPHVIRRSSSHVSGCECSSDVDLCADAVKLVHQSCHLTVSLEIDLYSAAIILVPPNNNPNAQGHSCLN